MENSVKRKLMLTLVTLLFVAAGVAYGIYWFGFGQFEQSTDDAYVSGNLVQITPQLSSNVVAVYADDTQWVKMGQPLVALDGADAKLALVKAEAELAQTVRNVKQLYAVAGELKTNIGQRQAELEKAKSDLARRNGLIGEHAVSKEDLQHAQISLAQAQAALDAARYQLKAANVMVANTTLPQHPAVLKAEATLKQAYLAVQRLSIEAPVSGYVAKRSVQIGQHVNPDMPLMVIVPLNQIWVDANFKENQLGKIRIGQAVALTTDIYGKDVVFHGRVAGLGAGTGNVFSLLPAQNATGNWIKVVQRLPVRVTLDAREVAAHPLRIGLSMLADVDTHDQRGKILSTMEQIAPLYTTGIFADKDKSVNQLIANILQKNS